MTRMNPKRICMSNFIQPLCIGATRVNLNCEAESRNQDCLIRLEVIRMNVTLEVSRECVLRPTPIVHRLRVELQFATRRRKAAFDRVANLYSGKPAPIAIAIRQWNGNNVWTSRFCGTCERTSKRIDFNVVQLFFADSFGVDLSYLVFDLKRAIAAHEFKRRQIFRRGFFGETWNRVIEYPLVVFIDAQTCA